jgi:ABC-type antimicrobial peptide transport system permease subunit
LKEGRYFSETIQSDTAAVVINETAVQAFGMKNPVGKWLSWGDDQRYSIIGVVEDFHHLPMQSNIDPLTMFYAPEQSRLILLKTSGQNRADMNSLLEASWNRIASEFPFEPTYLKDIYERTYSDEARLIRIIGYFAVLAILISCLGLFALSTYLAEQRRKEIGIRKVLGATVQSIVTLVSREFFYWILFANLIAWPIAWLALKNWLQGYAYHTRISPDIFILALLLSLMIALLTVAYQSLSSANKKPVDSIKYE